MPFATMLPSVDGETAALLSARLMMCRCSRSPVRTSAPPSLHVTEFSLNVDGTLPAAAGRWVAFKVASSDQSGLKWKEIGHRVALEHLEKVVDPRCLKLDSRL